MPSKKRAVKEVEEPPAEEQEDMEQEEEEVVETKKRPSRQAKKDATSRMTKRSKQQDESEDEFEETPKKSRGGRKSKAQREHEEEAEPEEDEDEEGAAAGSAKATPVKKAAATPRSTAKGGSAKKSKAKSKAAEEEELAEASNVDDPALYRAAISGRKLQEPVHAWVERYEADREVGVLELLTTIFRFCGCDGTVTASMLRDVTGACEQLSQRLDESSAEYPIIKKPVVKARFLLLIETLVESAGTHLFDDMLLDTLVTWLTALSSMHYRAFRHTATLAGMKVGTCLTTVLRNLSTDLDTLQTQYESETKKHAKQSKMKVDSIGGRMQELKANAAMLTDILLESIFNGITIHRYRDTSELVRRDTIEGLGVWIDSHSGLFLDDKYLKYLGWCLNDKSALVREEALRRLAVLVGKEEYREGMEMFTMRFKDRMFKMCEDVDDGVVAEALAVQTCFLKSGLLDSEEQVKSICALALSRAKRVAEAAAVFAMEVMNQDKSSPSALFKFVRLYAPLCEHDEPALEYLIDSFRPLLDDLKDWPLLFKTMSEEEASKKKKGSGSSSDFSGQEISFLFATLHESIRLENGHSPAGREKRKPPAAPLAAFSEACSSSLLPLLKKNRADGFKCKVLCSLVQYMDLAALGQGKSVDGLLSQLQDIFSKHADADTLNACASALTILADSASPVHSKASTTVESLLDVLAEKVKELDPAQLPANAEGDADDDVVAVADSLRRLSSLAKLTTVTRLELDEAVGGVLQAAVDGDVHALIVVEAVRLQMCLLMSCMAEVDLKHPDADLVKVVVQRRDQAFAQMTELLSAGTEAVQREVYLAMMDLLHVFARQLKSENDDELIDQLVVTASKAQQQSLLAYVIDTVGTGESEEDGPATVFLALSRAVVYGVMDAPCLGNFFHVHKNKKLGAILRFALSQLRNKDGDAIALLTKTALEDLFQSSEGQQQQLNTAREALKWYALTFGPITERDRFRKMFIDIHRNGIIYAASRGAQYLELLRELVGRLMPQDRAPVSVQLEKSFGRDNSDASVKLYADALGARPTKSAAGTPRTASARKTGRKSQTTPGSRRKSDASAGAAASPIQWGVLPETSNLGDVGEALEPEDIESDAESEGGKRAAEQVEEEEEDAGEVAASSQRSWIPTKKKQSLSMTTTTTTTTASSGARRSYARQAAPAASPTRHSPRKRAAPAPAPSRRKQQQQEEEEEEEEEEEARPMEEDAEEDIKSSPPSQVMAVRRKRLSALVPDKLMEEEPDQPESSGDEDLV